MKTNRRQKQTITRQQILKIKDKLHESHTNPDMSYCAVERVGSSI